MCIICDLSMSIPSIWPCSRCLARRSLQPQVQNLRRFRKPWFIDLGVRKLKVQTFRRFRKSRFREIQRVWNPGSKPRRRDSVSKLHELQPESVSAYSQLYVMTLAFLNPFIIICSSAIIFIIVMIVFALLLLLLLCV